VCTLFRQSPRSRLKHVTRLGPTRYWISATVLMMVQDEVVILTSAWKCNRPTDLSHIQKFLDKIGSKIDCQVCRFSELTKLTISHSLEVSPLQQCTYTQTCYTVMPRSAKIILFRNLRNCPTLDSAVCKFQLPNNAWCHYDNINELTKLTNPITTNITSH